MRGTVITINAMALIAILFGSLQMFAGCVGAAISSSTVGAKLRDSYVHYARWLVAGLTLQLGADIIATMITPDWMEIGRLAATATIRTLLNYFLERDLKEALGVEEKKSIASIGP
jgi:uncharacterized membrane protein